MDNLKASALLLALALLPACGMAEGTMLGVQVKDTPAPTAVVTASPTPAPAEQEADLSAAVTQAEMDAAGLGTRILWRGMEGEDVALMQRRLYQLGYYLGEIDGVFGLGTRTAVYGFQRAHKLGKIDGKVGPETIAMMFSDTAIVKPTPTPTPTPTPRPTPTPTATPLPTPVPTAVPDAAGAPFALEEAELYVDELLRVLMLGKAEEGEWLYPLCGVLSHMGYEYETDGASWSFVSSVTGKEIALMTGGLQGRQADAMGAADGVLFLADDEARVYVYGQEAYVTAQLLQKLGVSCLLVGGTPVIHE